ncbi:MAG TPA: hypothetical protein VK590_13625 [Saprospiraceae bacterium]|nr:hypothetical protein [Saprospiraceae bacterium]
MNRITLIICAFLFISLSQSFSQGCSDAGFCSLGILKNPSVNNIEDKLNTASIGMIYGAGFEKTTIFSQFVEYQRKLSSIFTIDAKLTSVIASGFLGSNTGLGDIYLTASYKVGMARILGGFKIPLNDANGKNKENMALPMEYQSSLGTFDLIAGVAISPGKHWELSLATQINLSANNKNSFFPGLYSDERANEFANTNKFERKPDLLFRLGYRYKIKEKWNIKPDLVALYHLGEDTYTSPDGLPVPIKNSDGLTINAVIMSNYAVSDNSGLEILLAAPFLVREVRPDGLTRSLVFSLQYKLSF